MTTKTSRLIRIASAMALLALVPLLAACATSTPATSSDAASPSAPATGSAASDATVKLLEPVSGAEVPAGTVTVKVETTGLTFTMPSNTNVEGEGHVHFILDDRPDQMSTEPQAEIADVEPGPHTLTAVLVQNNTEPFDPPIEAVVEFTAK